MIEIKKGDEVRFSKGNKIRYFGDGHIYKRGIPSEITFKIEKQAQNGFWISGPGYGERGNYGQGSISVDSDDIISNLVKKDSLRKQYRDLEMRVFRELREKIEESSGKFISCSLFNYTKMVIRHDRLTFLDSRDYEYSVYSDTSLEDLIEILEAQ